MYTVERIQILSRTHSSVKYSENRNIDEVNSLKLEQDTRLKITPLLCYEVAKRPLRNKFSDC